ncbi:hypothetical protein N136_02366 [Leifsonia aquatica ATCC 14665]|uniref:Uncharacterized protein n=1 Tax=Leifsonia aquatica ATCC 14665 TaxID=1358026 RepID=U2RRU1_LEIAQ|nr:hypothetical protein N136_02366 [Leifsonia aquatica ATCC 14665]
MNPCKIPRAVQITNVGGGAFRHNNVDCAQVGHPLAADLYRFASGSSGRRWRWRIETHVTSVHQTTAVGAVPTGRAIPGSRPWEPIASMSDTFASPARALTHLLAPGVTMRPSVRSFVPNRSGASAFEVHSNLGFGCGLLAAVLGDNVGRARGCDRGRRGDRVRRVEELGGLERLPVPGPLR